MKLISLKIGDLPKEKQFRSLHSGFRVDFHSTDEYGFKAMESFNPFCFAGLNGSGKSNVLEAISSIFYHLECCVAKFQSDSFKKYFRKEICTPDAFTLRYFIGQHNNNPYALNYFHLVTITKLEKKAPKMEIQEFPFGENVKKTAIDLEPPKDGHRPADGKSFLPDTIIGYSSGENEILSLPYIKSRLLHFDEYKRGTEEGYRDYVEPENSLIYIDAEMSQAVLLANLIFEEAKAIDKEGNEIDGALKPIVDELSIVGIRSFRMNLNLHKLKTQSKDDNSNILDHISEKIDILKKCATCWFTDEKLLRLDFYVDEFTKIAFKEHFTTSFNLFRLFQLLYELNANFIDESIIEEVYKSKGFYTDGKLPVGSPAQNVFYFLDYYILKQIEGESEPRPLLLREFSDGEHQFLHTMGICLMLKDRRSILLLDEPETHFNPNWRAKFVKILGDSITAGNKKDSSNGNFNVHLLKDVLLSSHSPFIVSDCMPNSVIFFDRNKETKELQAINAKDLGLKTYGSSVDYILKNFFKTNLISNKSLEELKNIIDNGTIDELRKAVEVFGESSQKQFLFKKIYEKMQYKDDSQPK